MAIATEYGPLEKTADCDHPSNCDRDDDREPESRRDDRSSVGQMERPQPRRTNTRLLPQADTVE